jgi:hypothetical protein
MENQSSGTAVEYEIETSHLPWKWLERRTARAFTLGGALLIASALVPIGLASVTEWSWVSGLVLVGISVVAIGVGLLGTVPQVRDRAPWLTRIGILCATVAGVAAVGLILLVGTAVTAAVTLGSALPKPMGVFQVLALAMAGGLALGFVMLGVARVRTGGSSDIPGRLLVAGGVVLLIPVLGELLRMAIGIGPPPWILFGALGVLALDTLAVGYSFRTGSVPPR